MSLSSGTIGLGILLLAYIMAGTWFMAREEYRITDLEKTAQAAAVETLTRQQLADEFTMKTHEQRLNSLDNYLRSHPWASQAAAAAK